MHQFSLDSLQGVPSVVPKNLCTGLIYENSFSRSMSLLLPMISRHLNVSLLAFCDIVSDLILANVVFPTGDNVFSLFVVIALKILSVSLVIRFSTKALVPFWPMLYDMIRWSLVYIGETLPDEILMRSFSLYSSGFIIAVMFATRLCQSCSYRSIRALS